MTIFNFADAYKAAGFSPGPDIVGRRRNIFDKVRQGVTAAMTVDLVRLYYGFPISSEADWFRDAFAENDPSFSMLDNEREAAVLSACLLSASIRDGKSFASLALLTASAAGNRTPLVTPGLLEEARQALYSQALQRRHATDSVKISPPLNDKTPRTTNAPVPGAKQGRGTYGHLVTQVNQLQEEVDMLWWYIGGWSRVLEQPFSDLTEALSAVMAGLDLANLTKKPTGPAAAPAILQRLIGTNQKTPVKLVLKEVVDAFPRESFGRLGLGNELKRVPDLCPVLMSLLSASEIGGSPAWYGPFRAASQLDPDATFHPLELAIQVYRERLLLSQLD